MNSEELDSHLAFLHDYSIKHGIIFRIGKKTASIEVIDKGDTP